MQLTTNKFTLKQLFSSSNEQFIIPGYQRRNAKDFKQQKALFEDIELRIKYRCNKFVAMPILAAA